MNRHVQSAVLTLIHPDVPTSSAQTPYGQGTDAESSCAMVCAHAHVCVCVYLHENIHCQCVVCVRAACVQGCCTITVSLISCLGLKTASVLHQTCQNTYSTLSMPQYFFCKIEIFIYCSCQHLFLIADCECDNVCSGV